MFGYILPNKGELSTCSEKKLNMYYCSLCIETKIHYGNIARFFINYDILLLLIILEAVSQNKQFYKKTNCLIHINKPFKIEKSENLSYICDVNMLIVYYKSLDNINDRNNIKDKLLINLTRKYPSNTSYKFLNKCFKENINRLTFLEKMNLNYSLDSICHPMANLIGLILENSPDKYKNSIQTRHLLYNLGYNIGKWIYLIDAIDDLKEDIKNHNFNPLLNIVKMQDKYDLKDKLSIILYSLLDNSMYLINKLNINKNIELLDNIINISAKNLSSKILANTFI